MERAGTKAGNKGWDAALGAIEMANLMAAVDDALSAISPASGRGK